MKPILLAVMLLQANPQGPLRIIRPQAPGVVIGVVRGANGAPAAGVRVYAIAVRDTADAATTAPPPLESLTQTDDAGRYRLETPAGRYFIAAGSVGQPTYYPGTTSLESARAVTVTSDGVVENIDFSTFVRPTAFSPGGFAPIPPSGTGVLTGVLRYPDGSPAAGVNVVASPAKFISGASMGAAAGTNVRITASFSVIGALSRVIVTSNNGTGEIIGGVTDANGYYRLENVTPDTHYIAAGLAEAPTYYPGTPDLSAAMTITTTQTTKLDNLNFTVPVMRKLLIAGRVTTLDGVQPGATIKLQRRSAPSGIGLFSLARAVAPPNPVVLGALGEFAFGDLYPGTYMVEANFAGSRMVSKEVVISDQSATDIELLIPVLKLSGRIVGDDGSALSDAQVFREILVKNADNPAITTILPVAPDGTFSRAMDAGDYRVVLRTLPEEYAVHSMMAGTTNILEEPFKLDDKSRTDIQIRMRRRTDASRSGSSVSGRALDSVSGAPTPATRVTLCCIASGPAEQLTSPLAPDGSFAFAAVPPGQYSPGFEVAVGQTHIYPVVGTVNVYERSISDLQVATTSSFVPIYATVVVEGGGTVPEGPAPISVVFVGSGGRSRVVSERGSMGNYGASVPVGDRYDVVVEGLPPGFVVKSVDGSTVATLPNYPAIGAPVRDPLPIVITLARTSAPGR